ncbi:MAG: GerMN domain-containing protein [Myxococcota bacterium]
MRMLIAFALLFTAGCTCNEGGNPAARPGAPKMGKMKGKTKGKMKGKTKGKVPQVGVALYFVDAAKLEAGDADPWVKVDRQVGAKTPAKNAVWQLFKGPTPEEEANGLKLITSGAGGFTSFDVQGNTATLQLRDGCDSAGSTVTVWDHISKTLKEFPEIEHVKLLGPDGSTQDDGSGDAKPACLEP